MALMNLLVLLVPGIIVFYLVILCYRKIEYKSSLVVYYVLELSGFPLGFFLLYLSQIEHIPLFGIAGMLMALQPIYWLLWERRRGEF